MKLKRSPATIDDILFPIPADLSARLAGAESRSAAARVECEWLDAEIGRLEAMGPEEFEQERARRHKTTTEGVSK